MNFSLHYSTSAFTLSLILYCLDKLKARAFSQRIFALEMKNYSLRIPSKLPFIEVTWRAAAALLIIYAVCFFLFAVWVVDDSGYMNLPPEVGDGQAYDNIAYNLLHGNGFGHDWSIPEWREPYLKTNSDGYYDWVLEHDAPYSPTAFRPPLYPVLLSGIYASFGRNFAAWRYANIAITVTAAVLSVALVYQLVGIIPALLSAAFAFFDTSLLFYIHRFMTEPLAALLVVILLFILLRCAAHPKRIHFMSAGTVFGIMLLLRNLFLLWLPFILCLLWIAARRGSKVEESLTPVSGLFLFLAPALILSIPWYARNCLTTHEFMPTGTQGARVMAVGYSDAMFETGGKWTFKKKVEILSTFSAAEVPGIEGEVLMAKEGRQRTADWISVNTAKLPQLAAIKTTSLWWSDAQGYQRFLIVLSLLGLVFVFGSPAFLVFSALLLANTAAIAVTWNVPHGRFLIPIHPLLYCLASCGLYMLGSPLRTIFKMLRSGREQY